MRDRIIDLRRVPAGDLRPSPDNWRTHPPGQRDALEQMLRRIGLVDAVIARETADGLELVDGHLRADVASGETLPVLVVDLTDDEAAQAMATLDPIAAMAETDTTALTALLARLETEPPIDLAALTTAAPDDVPRAPNRVPPEQVTPPVRLFGTKVRSASMIVAALPDDHRCYIEPHGGMLSVLLARPPAAAEIANDLNGDIVAFWAAVRDHPEELARRVRATPSARSEFVDCAQRLATGGIEDPLERARCFAVAAQQSIGSYGLTRRTEGQWRRHMLHCGDWHRAQEADWGRVAARLQRVQLDCTDAADLIAAAPPEAVIYCDPPYVRTSNTTPYRVIEVAGFEAAAIDAAERGCRVAVSGYAGDWPQIAERWHSVRWADRTGSADETGPARVTVRTEVLWLSYPPDMDRLAAVGITSVEEPE